MKRIYCRFCYIFLLFAACLSAAIAAISSASVSGVTQNAKHQPLAGAHVSLRERSYPGLMYQATTDPSGAFHFLAVAAGEYTISAARDGYRTPAPTVLHIGSSPVAVELDLSPNASTTAPQFQSSGIRGLIDPGGYSASSDGAASDLLRGMADLQRAGGQTRATAEPNVPCSAELPLRKALAEHPDEAEANRQLGQFYAMHGEEAAAMPLLRKALQLDPQGATAVKDFAALLLQTGGFNQARLLLEPIAKTSLQPEMHQLLARADEGTGMFAQAGNQYRVADNEAPSRQSAFGIGYESLLEGSSAGALVAFEAGVQRYPRSIRLRLGAGIAQMLAGNTSAALDSFLLATDADPWDPRPYSFVVKAFQLSGEEGTRVRASLRRFVALAPDNADACSLYASILARMPDSHSDHIEDLLKRAIALNPSLSEAHLQLANQYAQQGQYASAIQEYRTALSLDSKLREAHYRLALAYKHTGQLEESGREMQRFRVLANEDDLDEQRSAVAGTSLSQFISVMHAPSSQAQADVGCPASAD